MDAPNNNEENREQVPKPLSPTFLDSHTHSWADPPLSDYNQPQFPSNLYDTPIRHASHHTRPIQPFRRYNYLEAQGEDLGSRQYTLGPDNNWEFTSVYVPNETWSLPPAATTQNSPTSRAINQPLPPSPIIPAPAPPSPIASGSTITLEMLPPTSPSNSRSSPETPITPVTPGPEPGPSRRVRRSSNGKKVWGCEECNKTFYRKAELDRHLKYATVHQQERQFKCRYCGYVLTRPDARTRHERMCLNNPDDSGSPKGKGKAKDRSSSSD